jgi:hypothetical protein
LLAAGHERIQVGHTGTPKFVNLTLKHRAAWPITHPKVPSYLTNRVSFTADRVAGCAVGGRKPRAVGQ